MRHKLIQPRKWKIKIIMSCVFWTLSNVVFGGKQILITNKYNLLGYITVNILS